MQLEKMITEGSNTASAEIDRVSTLEMCRIINDEDKTVPLAVERVLPDIAAAIDVIHAQVSGGGRLIYLGAGTSGRLGILDASECPPTYGVKPGLVVGLIAGGEYAIQHAVEGTEDSREGGINDLKNINLTAQDVVVGITASGRTPYVIAGLEYARQLGCRTVEFPVIRECRFHHRRVCHYTDCRCRSGHWFFANESRHSAETGAQYAFHRADD